MAAIVHGYFMSGANQVARNVGAKMRGIETAKDSVPIGIVALRALEEVARFGQILGGFGAAAAAWRRRDATRDA